MAGGYESYMESVNVISGRVSDVGQIKLTSDTQNPEYYEDQADMLFDQAALEDDETGTQSIATLTGASDNIYYNTASYNFGPMYCNFRGYDSRYNDVYINGLKFNDLIRGQFSYSTLLGMTSRAFRNKTTSIGISDAAFGFGGLGSSTNYNTVTSSYAPGFNGSVAYTNSNYMLRGMVTYSTGINKHGWGATISAIGRYANEGVVEGTFYNSAGLFLSLEKVFNPYHSLTFTAFGGPTQRAGSKATFKEAYELAGTNLYNPAWGYQDGKKRSSKIIETFDPTMILNWIFKPSDRTVLNTAAAVRWVNYSTSGFNYTGNNPSPDYYKRMPFYFLAKGQEGNYEEAMNLWTSDESYRQINWGSLYQQNYLNNYVNETNNLQGTDRLGSSYILENYHSNQFVTQLNSYLNHRINDYMALQAGISFNYTNASFYKTVRDLLGGEFWVDIDTWSDLTSTLNPDYLQNNLDEPNKRIYEGDRFGYDYNIYAIQGSAWLQNTINLPKWDINYGLSMTYTQYQRDGHMRNGRAPLESYGKSSVARFDDAMFKAGAIYKLDGRNYFAANVEYGTKAPIANNIYVLPKLKNTYVPNLESERIFSSDLSYIWNYRRFRGTLTGFYTSIDNATEYTVFFDDNYSSNVNYALTGVRKDYKGIELGMSYKLTPSLTASFAGTIASYRYKNNPQGTRSFDNGQYADTTQTVYLKNYYAGQALPQTIWNLGLDWQAPKNWFFNINGTWMGNAHVQLSPAYHEVLSNLWTVCPSEEALAAKVAEFAEQEKLSDEFVLNLSIGKLLYINRKVSMNFNLSVNNILNNKNVITQARQQGRIDTSDYNLALFPNKYSYAQGTRVFLNVGVRF
jgi:hypothetical protein